MNIKKLIEAAKKPAVYTPGTASMWVDEYISSQLLQTHLSQDTDLASRKETTISSTIDWIETKIPGDRLEILDLGCGPGLYAEQLAERGHLVTGMDFSVRSINYARASAQKKKLNISYLHQDYLQLAEENKYDLICMIFTDFGVLSPEQRTILSNNIQL
ncbi:MAG: class I SAM-dependent methyltransferase, partial [Candidatus Electrothrix sp. AR3]|nr:class I SAM-dependent methyltransferase [Candidatus Electrothrix sp. AR3]